MKNIRNAYYTRGRCYAKGIGEKPVTLIPLGPSISDNHRFL